MGTNYNVDSNGNLTIRGIADIGESVQTPFGGVGRYQNLLRFSEEFDDAAWVKLFSVTVTADNATAPNGDQTADTVSWASATNVLGLRQSSLGTVIGNTYTVSFWARHVSGTDQDLVMDLRDGAGVGVTVDSTFRRYSVTLVAGSGGDFLDIANAISGSVFEIWGMQIVDGAEILPYTKTTDTALSIAVTPNVSERISGQVTTDNSQKPTQNVSTAIQFDTDISMQGIPFTPSTNQTTFVMPAAGRLDAEANFHFERTSSGGIVNFWMWFEQDDAGNGVFVPIGYVRHKPLTSVEHDVSVVTLRNIPVVQGDRVRVMQRTDGATADGVGILQGAPPFTAPAEIAACALNLNFREV